MSTPAPNARVFFALWPDPNVQHALMELGRDIHRRVGGKPTREESIHMTLLFLGDTPAERIDVLEALAAAVAFEPFDLAIERAECWKHNQIGWAAPAQTPQELAHLVEALEAGADMQGFRFDRRPFAPHITLVRRARCAPLQAPKVPVQWRVRDFVLVRSQLNTEGSRYSVIGRWPQA